MTEGMGEKGEEQSVSSQSERVKTGIARARASKGKWGRPSIAEIKGDPDLPVKALEMRSQGLSLSRIAFRLNVSKTTARRLVITQKGCTSEGQEGDDDCPTPNGDTLKACAEKMTRLPVIEKEEDPGNLASMPCTFRIFKELLEKARSDGSIGKDGM